MPHRGGDDGFSYLAPDRYVEVRLNDQLNYFKKKSVGLEKQLKRLYWGMFVVGGIGTFLAAIGQQVWIALTTSIAAALGTYLGYKQAENTLTKYNQAATDLSNVKSWWNALSAQEQSLQQNIDSLVEHTEQVLQSELDGWIQQMQNALAELRKEQETRSEKEEKKEPPVPASKAASEQNKDKLKAEAEQVNGSLSKSATAPTQNEIEEPGADKIEEDEEVAAGDQDESADNAGNGTVNDQQEEVVEPAAGTESSLEEKNEEDK